MTETEKLIKESKQANENGDYDKVIDLLRQAAALGDAAAMEFLGEIYKNGDLDVKSDLKKSNYYFIKAADNGSVYAMEQLAGNYRDGDGVREDQEKSIKYFQMAADNGSTYGCCTIAQYYYDGKYFDRDYSKAMEYFKKAADPNAKVKSFLNISECASMFRLGEMYEKGEGVEKDLNQAIEWYKKSVDLDTVNSKNSIRQLVEIYQLNEEFKNISEVIKYLLILVEDGDFDDHLEGLIEWFLKNTVEDILNDLFKGNKVDAAESFYKLGRAYKKALENKTARKDDLEKCAELFKRAGELGSVEAIYQISEMKLADEYLEKDHEKNIEYLKKAAELNNVDAMIKLGEMYQDGDGVDQNYSETSYKKSS